MQNQMSESVAAPELRQVDEPDLFSVHRQSKFFLGLLPHDHVAVDKRVCVLCGQPVPMADKVVEELHRIEMDDLKTQGHVWVDDWGQVFWCMQCEPELREKSERYSKGCNTTNRRNVCKYTTRPELIAACSAYGIEYAQNTTIPQLQSKLNMFYVTVATTAVVPKLVESAQNEYVAAIDGTASLQAEINRLETEITFQIAQRNSLEATVNALESGTKNSNCSDGAKTPTMDLTPRDTVKRCITD